jgi:hypothetical protein
MLKSPCTDELKRGTTALNNLDVDDVYCVVIEVKRGSELHLATHQILAQMTAVAILRFVIHLDP